MVAHVRTYGDNQVFRFVEGIWCSENTYFSYKNTNGWMIQVGVMPDITVFILDDNSEIGALLQSYLISCLRHLFRLRAVTNPIFVKTFLHPCTTYSELPSYISNVCPRSSDPFYILSYYIIWVTTSWTDGYILLYVQEDVSVCIESSRTL